MPKEFLEICFYYCAAVPSNLQQECIGATIFVEIFTGTMGICSRLNPTQGGICFSATVMTKMLRLAEFWLIEEVEVEVQMHQISNLFPSESKITATCSVGIRPELLNIPFINCTD